MSKTADACAVAAAIVFPTLLTLVYFVWLNEYATAKQITFGVGKVLQFAFPLVWIFAIRRRASRWPAGDARGIGLGLAFGALVAGAMLILYWGYLRPGGFFAGNVQAEVVEKIGGFGINQLWQYVALGAFYALVHSLLEEYYWRWFVFGQLRKLVPLAPAVVISSLGFMAHHVILLAVYFGWNSPLTYIFSLCVAVGGGVWASIYARRSSLWGPWLSHLLVDAAIFLIGYDLARELF